jgi:lipopolysaccharide export system protein LptA
MAFKKYLVLVIFIFAALKSYAQQEQYITVVGDSLVGRMISGESIREVFGHVILTQGNVKITCNHAIQYLSRNDAELIGNVIATQDTLTIITPRAFYYGNERKAKSVSGLKLDDKKVILTADSGVYFFNQHKAVFETNVNLFDTSSTLTSNALTYFRDEGKAVAVGNVKIIQSSNIIVADSLIHFRETKITYAFKNVRVSSTANNSFIYGDHLEDYPAKHYSLIDKNPLFIQIDTSYIKKIDTSSSNNVKDTILVMQLDTLVIKSEKMEAYRDTLNVFKAEDSVKIVRGDFASRNDFTEYYRTKGLIVTKKINTHAKQPVIWYENSQLTGDSVTIFLIKNKITKLEVDNNAFIMSQNEIYKKRFDQMSGSKIIIFFNDTGIRLTEVYGGVHSIYYLYNDNSPNGLTKSSSETSKIYFEDKKVSTVKLYGTPTSEFYPENKVKGDELSFTLPGFIIHKNRPFKNELLSIISQKKFSSTLPVIKNKKFNIK